ncbi:GntR family transcriptional regulator [Xylanimonas oleitrophica]|uniref:GntR family transcriptional regulator n=1 Tax=Xylanimonas oleitrophica TaxID=2607479 RepID=A0A2W5X0L6_9MICO|nr:GntR family transcriptional regulator [Xylanimonas oleitrophica]PZR54236.1 GntR family transcriptional regulator [Xylanimonas oleitrophica]
MTALTVDVSAPTPVYEQIRAQVAGLVAVGALRPGDRLPASRDLARDLGIAVGTVQRAYRELEAQGVVASRRRVGTVVTGTTAAGTAPPAPREPASPAGTASAQPPTLLDDVRSLVTRARAEGIQDGELLALVRGALTEDERGDVTSPRVPR